MKIEYLETPFPHVYCENFFDEKELELIWQELKFLSHPKKLFLPGVHHGNPMSTDSRALHLELAYGIQSISHILEINKKTLKPEFVNPIVEKWPFFMRLKFIDNVITKARYYHNGAGYAPHTDIKHDFLTFSYFHTQPKKFTGGELYCPDYDYTIDCSNNTLIFLPSYVKHAVTNVEINGDDYWSGNGRYCISQFLSITKSAEGHGKRN